MPDPATGTDPLEFDMSVVISTYVRPVQVREAIAAIVAQDHPGAIETLVVWDKNEPEWELASDDPHRPVRILFNDHGNGLPGSRNCGAAAASAPILGFCDDDDLWLPAKAGRQLALLKETGADCSTTGLEVLVDGNVIPRRGTDGILRYADLLRSRRMEAYMGTAVVRAEAFWNDIGPLDEHIPGGYAEDYDWMLRATAPPADRGRPRAAAADALDRAIALPRPVARLGGRAHPGARPEPGVLQRAEGPRPHRRPRSRSPSPRRAAAAKRSATSAPPSAGPRPSLAPCWRWPWPPACPPRS